MIPLPQRAALLLLMSLLNTELDTLPAGAWPGEGESGAAGRVWAPEGGCCLATSYSHWHPDATSALALKRAVGGRKQKASQGGPLRRCWYTHRPRGP